MRVLCTLTYWSSGHVTLLRGKFQPTNFFPSRDLLGLRNVIVHVTIGLSVGTFPLVVNAGLASILHRYGDI